MSGETIAFDVWRHSGKGGLANFKGSSEASLPRPLMLDDPPGGG